MNESKKTLLDYLKEDKNSKWYKDESIYIGSSDIASLTVRTPMEAFCLDFGIDDDYKAWLVTDPEVEIPDHYKLVKKTTNWIRIYDDDGLACRLDGDKIEIYRAGEMGCLIRVI